MPPPKPEVSVEDDKLSFVRLEEAEDSPSTPSTAKVFKATGGQKQYPDFPLELTFRPSSDTILSDLSTYSNDRRNGRPTASFPAGERIPSLSPAPPRTWRGRLRAFWLHNKGLALVLLAQFFGGLMNVTTRLLELNGPHGEGMHPFQVSHSLRFLRQISRPPYTQSQTQANLKISPSITQILFARMSITVLCSCSYMWYASVPDAPFGARSIRWLLVLRGMGGFFGVFGLYCTSGLSMTSRRPSCLLDN